METQFIGFSLLDFVSKLKNLGRVSVTEDYVNLLASIPKAVWQLSTGHIYEDFSAHKGDFGFNNVSRRMLL